MEVMPAKRSGYFEVTGSLEARLPGGVRLTAISRKGEPPDRTVTIEADGARAVVDQAAKTLTFTLGGKTSLLTYAIPYQSAITAQHVARILRGEPPDLPGYASAARVHKAMIAALLEHFRKALAQPGLEECPVT
jgi:hypothetical protein